jgi:hypothetical protein
MVKDSIRLADGGRESRGDPGAGERLRGPGAPSLGARAGDRELNSAGAAGLPAGHPRTTALATMSASIWSEIPPTLTVLLPWYCLDRLADGHTAEDT